MTQVLIRVPGFRDGFELFVELEPRKTTQRLDSRQGPGQFTPTPDLCAVKATGWNYRGRGRGQRLFHPHRRVPEQLQAEALSSLQPCAPLGRGHGAWPRTVPALKDLAVQAEGEAPCQQRATLRGS